MVKNMGVDTKIMSLSELEAEILAEIDFRNLLAAILKMASNTYFPWLELSKLLYLH